MKRNRKRKRKRKLCALLVLKFNQLIYEKKCRSIMIEGDIWNPDDCLTAKTSSSATQIQKLTVIKQLTKHGGCLL